MKRVTIIFACTFLIFVAVMSQEFVYHSDSPFGIQLATGIAGISSSNFYFFDYDFDGDQDMFQTGLDYFENVSQPDWEHLHFFLKVQENIGNKSDPVYAPPVNFDDNFPFPVGYFSPSSGDLNQDNIADFIVGVDIDDIGNQSVLQITGTGSGFDVINLSNEGLYPFVAESFYTPHLVDLDLDGDLDLLMSGFNPAFGEESGPDIPNYYYARNAGTNADPLFEGWYANPYGLSPNPYAETLSSGDIDNDGDVDLIGATIFLPADSSSYIHVHLNSPLAGKPNFPETLNSPFGLPELHGVNQFFSPTLVDIDDDGDLDFFVIELTSDTSLLHFYENLFCAPEQSTMEVSICEGDVFKFMGVTYNQAGVYEILTEGTDGCDSTIILTILELPLVTSNLNASICFGEEFIIGSDVLTEPGNYTIFIAASNGCDSIINLTLDVLPDINVSLIEVICSGGVFVIGGESLTDAGDYTFVFEAANGCDSIVNLSLSVLPDFDVPIDELLCEGDVYIIGGDTLDEAGTYFYTLQASNGCDSIVHLTLFFDFVDNTVTLTETTLTANMSNAFYQWFNCDTGEDVPFASSQSFTPTVTGNYAVRIEDQFGCTAVSACTHVIITSTEDEALSNKITLYPNPASARIFILHAENFTVESVTVTDMCGQQIQDLTLENDNSIDVSNLVGGIYLMRIKVDGREVVKRVMII